MARFSPSFHGEIISAAEAEQIILERACKVLCHELSRVVEEFMKQMG